MKDLGSISLIGAAFAISMISVDSSSAASSASDQDRMFVDKISQGGMYGVGLGEVAESRGAAQDIEDQGNTEAHDHELVGKALKTAADSAGIDFSSELNAEFKERLGRISIYEGEGFDDHDVEDMDQFTL